MTSKKRGFVPRTLREDVFLKEGNTALASAKQVLEDLAGLNRVHVSTALVNTDQAQDDVPNTIVREAQKWHADLVVMGTHGRRGVVRCLLGSVASTVAGTTRTPLLMVRQKDDP